MTAQNSNAIHNAIQINLIKFYHKDYYNYICGFNSHFESLNNNNSKNEH